MAFSMTIIEGRLTKEPELRNTNSGKQVATLSVAVDRDFSTGADKKVDFFNVTVWGKTAEFVGKYFHKGDGILVEGSMQNDPYEKDGQKRDSWKLNAARVTFPLGKSGGSAPVEKEASAPVFVPGDPEDGDLPF